MTNAGKQNNIFVKKLNMHNHLTNSQIKKNMSDVSKSHLYKHSQNE